MKLFYLLFAIIGAVVPFIFFIDFFQTEAQSDFIGALFVNGAAGGFSADLLITSFVFWIYMWKRKSNGPNPVPFIFVNLFIGLSCALPAYLYFSMKSDKASLEDA
ncbi:DUF2834 domain-containing protein [Alteromonadaceae bacterium M269]|nr:DUF2834 domain-containing protein [Alteromonadaceae bacterium M269]